MNNVHFAIPEIYGETLSYYELLSKLVDKTNDLIENYNTVPDQIAEAVTNLDASQLFSTVLNQLIHSIATDNTKSANAVKVYKKHDLLYAAFNETVNLYESLIDFSTGTATELIPGTNIREVNISELFIELRKLIDINKNNIENVTAVANENSEAITTMHNDITNIENKNTEQDSELSTLRTMISTPYNFKGDVASISALPETGNINDTYYVQDVKYKVTWTGSAWVQSSLSEADYQTELSELKSDLTDFEKAVKSTKLLRKEITRKEFGTGSFSPSGMIINGSATLYKFEISGVSRIFVSNTDMLSFFANEPKAYGENATDNVRHLDVESGFLDVPNGTNWVVSSPKWGGYPAVKNADYKITFDDEISYSKYKTDVLGVTEFTDFTMIDGKFINVSGEEVNNSNYACSEYISTDDVTEVYTSIGGSATIAFYDENKAFLSYYKVGKEQVKMWYKLNSPVNAKYFRFSNYIIQCLNSELRCFKSPKKNSVASPVSMYDKTIHIGDSLTYSQVFNGINPDGTHIERQAFKTYPQIFGELCHTEARSIAFPGATTKTWWQRFSEDAFNGHGLYIVFLGTNGGMTDTIETDCAGDDLSQYADTATGYYGRILQSIKNNGDKAVLIQLYGGGGYDTVDATMEITNSVIAKFAERYNFPYIDIRCPELLDWNYHYWADKTNKNMLHFNDLGYTWMAKKIKEQIDNLPTSEQFKISRTQ